MSARGYMSPRRLAEMTAALRTGDSFVKIAADNDMSVPSVRRWLQPVIDLLTEHGREPRWIAKVAGHRAPITADQKAEIKQRLTTALSIRQIAQAMNLDKSTVTKIAKPLIAAMREAGSLGLCECGQDRFHQRICSRTAGTGATEDQLRKRIEVTAAIMAGDSFAAIAERFGMGGPTSARRYLRHLTPEQRRQRKVMESARSIGEQPEKRAAVVAAILRGETYSAIADRLGMSANGVARYLRWLTPEQRERRKALERDRTCGTAEPALRPFIDATYSQIAAAMPRWLSEAARDDAISDMYLAHLEGAVSMSDVAAEARRFASRTVAAFESKFGPRSLDEKLFDDGDTTLKDTLVDPAALEAFDYIFEEAL